MEGYIAEIRMFGGNFAPRNWQYCDGSLQSIAQNSAFFSLVGTMYGGNGQTTFAVPNLSGRTAIGAGSGAGLTPRDVGEMGGTETVALTSANIPPHQHAVVVRLRARNGEGNTADPSGAVLAKTADGKPMFDNGPADATMAAGAVNVTVGAAGGGQPIPNMMPFTVVGYIICASGIYPSRS